MEIVTEGAKEVIFGSVAGLTVGYVSKKVRSQLVGAALTSGFIKLYLVSSCCLRRTVSGHLVSPCQGLYRFHRTSQEKSKKRNIQYS